MNSSAKVSKTGAMRDGTKVFTRKLKKMNQGSGKGQNGFPSGFVRSHQLKEFCFGKLDFFFFEPSSTGSSPSSPPGFFPRESSKSWRSIISFRSTSPNLDNRKDD